ncbi:hypothetical protein R3X27_19115 [Tropicimonas sp. TH_r6]|uniref:hypothetical protein n=1 Tax=Tropicimonas sp. TH_r6 TaxID=3082085 RepID=UPI002954AB1B|nr:hypothetical protein [Tropicimonas sp. TH_r6]MDV7144796.1 hypothetical protein [Tropicimonas sp. TH_r6]
MKLIASLRRTAEKRAAYARTLRELRSMPLETAMDLDMDIENASSIARKAVYGA